MTSTLAQVTALILAVATLVTSATTAWITVRRIKPTVDATHEKATEIGNGQRARIDQLEQAVQAAGAPVPPVPAHPAETASEPI